MHHKLEAEAAGAVEARLTLLRAKQLAVAPTAPGFVVCESLSCIVTHVRHVGSTPVRLGGHAGDVTALCGTKIAWDTQIPVASTCVTCRGCRAVAGWS